MNLQENMGVEKQRVFEENEICVSDHINGFQYTSTKSDSFVVDMERFSHIIDKDKQVNSRTTVCFPFFSFWSLLVSVHPLFLLKIHNLIQVHPNPPNPLCSSNDKRTHCWSIIFY